MDKKEMISISKNKLVLVSKLLKEIKNNYKQIKNFRCKWRNKET